MRPRLDLVGVFLVVVSLVAAALPANIANAANCTSAGLQPTLAESMVTQGVGGTAPSGYATLTRGEDTLVKLFLTLPCTVTGSQYVKITNATLTGTTTLPPASPVAMPGPNSLFTSFATTPALPAIKQPESPADPVFVVPPSNLKPGPEGSSFTATFTATITYTFSDGTTGGTGTTTKTFPSFTKTFDEANALRVYIVPMGDKSQPFNTQYTPLDQTIVQNAMQTLSRIYPTTAGVADLSLASGGIRYVVDTATILDLKSVTNAYATNVNGTKFCGTSVNFSAIKGLLAQYLLTHNKANKNATADRVIGVVGGNGPPSSGPISFGSEDGIGCADGMASVSSAESWIRLIDKPGQTSRSGALAAMEVAHTFGLEQTPSYHSSKIEADLDATGANTDRSYNSASRSRIALDHSVMNYNTTGGPWNNDTTLLEANDFAYLFCKLRPSATTACSSPVNIGSSTGVGAAERYIIAGTTDGTPANTRVVEPYYATLVAETEASVGSTLRLLQLDTSSSPPTVVANFGMPWAEAVTDHDGVNVEFIQGGVRTFYAAAPGFTSAVGEVRLVTVGSATDLPPGSTVGVGEKTLFSSKKILDPPSTITLSASNPPPTTGGTVILGRSQITPRIPPKPDIVFLADTTGSMGGAIGNVRTNIASIMSQVKDAQPDAQFAAASYKDNVADEPSFCSASPDPYVFRIEQALTSDTRAVESAIADTAAGWHASGGCDIPESQINALFRLGIGDVVYRTGSSRVIAWFGDAPGHNPSNDHTLAAAIAELERNKIRVVAVNVGSLDSDDPGCTPCAGQATRITTETGGVLKTENDATKVAQAILDGLRDLTVTVTPVVNADACDPALSVGISPTSLTVTSGTTANFAETVTVASGTSAGTHTCQVQFKLNDQVQADPAFTQLISIDVGGTQQKYVKVTAQSSTPDSLLLDLIYECATFNFVAAVAVPPTEVAGTTATFNTNADTTNACARAGGGGTLVPYLSDGWNRVAGTTGATAETSTVPKSPTAAIYSPSIGAAFAWNSTLPLRGSGQVAGVELPESALSWSLIAPADQPTAAGSGNAGSGNAIDKLAPPNGWAKGTWTIRLTVTFERRTAIAERTFEVTTYQFLGFFGPVMNPPLINQGTAGKSFAFKWQLKSGGTAVTSLATVKSTMYALGCDPSPTTTFATIPSGQSVLRFDQTNMQFVFNWKTPSTPGLYMFRLTLTDGSTHDACLNLTK